MKAQGRPSTQQNKVASQYITFVNANRVRVSIFNKPRLEAYCCLFRSGKIFLPDDA